MKRLQKIAVGYLSCLLAVMVLSVVLPFLSGNAPDSHTYAGLIVVVVLILAVISNARSRVWDRWTGTTQ